MYYYTIKKKGGGNKEILLFSTKWIKFFKDISLTSKAKYPLRILSAYVSLTSNAIQVLKLFQKHTNKCLTDLPEKFIRGQQIPCSHF